MEHTLAALNATERQGVVRPVLELNVPAMRAIGNGDDARMFGAPRVCAIELRGRV